jgi:hypothetical protein
MASGITRRVCTPVDPAGPCWSSPFNGSPRLKPVGDLQLGSHGNREPGKAGRVVAYIVNTGMTPFCHSEDRPRSVSIATVGVLAAVATESSFGEPQPLRGSCEAAGAGHRRVGGLDDHHRSSSPRGTVDQFSSGLTQRDVRGLAGHRRPGQELELEVFHRVRRHARRLGHLRPGHARGGPGGGAGAAAPGLWQQLTAERLSGRPPRSRPVSATISGRGRHHRVPVAHHLPRRRDLPLRGPGRMIPQRGPAERLAPWTRSCKSGYAAAAVTACPSRVCGGRGRRVKFGKRDEELVRHLRPTARTAVAARPDTSGVSGVEEVFL